MYRKEGLINELLSTFSFGLIQGADWLNDPATAMPAIIALSIWQAAGFHMIIWLAGLQSISGELYEAAQLDGASRWHQFRYVTWPGLKHTRSLVLVTITIQALGLFDQVSVMTQGGPLDSTTTIIYEAVRSGFKQQETSYASAISPSSSCWCPRSSRTSRSSVTCPPFPRSCRSATSRWTTTPRCSTASPQRAS
jgi:multiple sugar transport system permease protein